MSFLGLWLGNRFGDVAGVHGGHHWCRVDWCTTTRMHLKVKVRRAGIARGTVGAKNLPGFDHGAGNDVRRNGVEVGVKKVGAVRHRKSHAVTSQTGIDVDLGDRSIHDCVDQVALWCDDVDTFMGATTAGFCPGVGE